jgi:TonB family protein
MRAERAAAFVLGVAIALGAGDAIAQPPATASPSVEPPSLLSEPDVPYPPGAAGEATVTLVLVIAPDGAVRQATAEGSTENAFSRAAVEAARGWRFRPATRAGVPIATKIKIAVTFRPPEIVPAPAPENEDVPGATGAAGTPPKAPAARVEEVRVRGEREPSRTVSLSRSEVRQIPGTFGDPFRAIEIMPGVTPIVSGLPFFFVRGAPPGDVGYFLDGIRVPYLFHVGAGPSVVHPALIDRVDLYPGGYPARYGRFAGGIVAGETTPPLDRPHGEGNVRVFDAGAMVETPFSLPGTHDGAHDGGREPGRILLGGRYSYTGFLFTLLSPDTILDYWDYQGRVTYDLGPSDQIGLFSFGAYDFLGQHTPTGDLTLFGTQFHRLDLRYDHKLGSEGAIRVAVTGGLDRSAVQEDRSVRSRLLGARSELTYALSPRVKLRAGTDVELDSYDVQANADTLAPSAAGVASLFPSRSDLVIGTRGDVVVEVLPGFEVTPGARLDLYASEGNTAIGVDPRLATRTEITRRTRLLAALGVAHQAPSFVVPVPGFQPGGLEGGLQKAYQESAGIEADLFEATTGTLTLYHNAFYDMSDPLGVSPPTPSGCAPGTFPTDTLAGDRGNSPTGNGGGATCGVPRFTPGTIGPDRSGGGGQAADSSGSQQTATAIETRTRGQAFGLEVFVKRRLTSHIGGFLSYTLSRSTRTYGGRDYIATFDRTHVLNTALAFDLGQSWRAGTRVTFYTGLPKEPDPTDPSTRLPGFFRLDLRLEKRWQLQKTWWISFVMEWMNATLSKEAVSTSCTLQGCKAQTIGPVTIPSVGVEGGF